MRLTLFVLLIGLSRAASAQVVPGAIPQGMPPKAVALTTEGVERLLKAIPEVTKEGTAQHRRMLASVDGGGPGQASPEDLQRMQAIFSKHGFTMEDFALQMSTLIATYMVLDPAALDAKVPTESSPEVKQALADPALTPEQKEIIRRQVAQAQQGKEALRSQFAQVATDDNKRIVRPYMGRIRQVLDAAEAQAKKAITGTRPGPRRKP